ncbi:ribbon-helix-helix protein, CopG family [Candidatus Micrarchaeota archaeon]|nr:ribbon-helix-helix protein, CopG family [Candidatus Micrarchaeota archaeon]
MDIHAKFRGEVAETIDEIIKRGRASTKTEAIRLAILDYRHHHIENEEERGFAPYVNRDIWEDKKEDKTWLKYLKGRKK